MVTRSSVLNCSRLLGVVTVTKYRRTSEPSLRKHHTLPDPTYYERIYLPENWIRRNTTLHLETRHFVTARGGINEGVEVPVFALFIIGTNVKRHPHMFPVGKKIETLNESKLSRKHGRTQMISPKHPFHGVSLLQSTHSFDSQEVDDLQSISLINMR